MEDKKTKETKKKINKIKESEKQNIIKMPLDLTVEQYNAFQDMQQTYMNTINGMIKRHDKEERAYKIKMNKLNKQLKAERTGGYILGTLAIIFLIMILYMIIF